MGGLHLPDAIQLDCTGIHVWSASLNRFETESAGFVALLSPAERTRASRFRKFKDRNYYVLGRALLRVLLGRYLRQDPAEIKLSLGRFGKPDIEGDVMTRPLTFSAAYSGELAVYAISSAMPIGVDVEHVRPIPHYEQVAERFFSVREAATLLSLSAACRLESFYACWTRKEAFLKATGDGIGNGLAEVEVTLAPGDPAEILRVPGASANPSHWRLKSFSPAPGYVAALAYKVERAEWAPTISIFELT